MRNPFFLNLIWLFLPVSEKKICPQKLFLHKNKNSI